MATISRDSKQTGRKTALRNGGAAPVYVNLTDKAFLRLHHGYGLPVITQTLTFVERRLSDAQLNAMYTLLKAGPLTRRVRRPAVPFARARWVPTDSALPLSVESDPIPDADAMAWANRQAQFPLDPDAGYGWRLSAVPTSSGGMIVCLSKSHAVADGHAGLMAEAGLVDPERATKGALATAVGFRDELADGMHRATTIAKQAFSEMRRANQDPLHRKAVVTALTTREPKTAQGSAEWQEQSAVLTFDAAQWRAIAARDGGTANTLYLALTADLLRNCPLIDGIPPVLTPAVRILREHNQSDANSFTRVPVVVQRDWLDNHDLTALRAASKGAFAAADTVGGGVLSRPRKMPPDLIDFLPEGVVHRLLETPPITIGMCSNMGVLDDFIAPELRESTPLLHMKRAVVQGLDLPTAVKQPVALATWLSEAGERIHWNLESLKPEMSRSATELANQATKVAASWGLHPLRIDTSDSGA
ncbi:hypothetical protein [Nocardia altamirensis]|uniref:hypothetical protein n=1 Tax=Nocardia altamirensis TaxID=472158 RepID=UPI00083FDB05|nr:hypothetical protein [Nocardia altamirensis]